MRIRRSKVLLTGCSIRGWSNGSYDYDTRAGYPGTPGLLVDASHLIVARTTLEGGRGAKGADKDWWADPGDGGTGGPGLLLKGASDVLALGCCGDLFRGGDGGDGGKDPFSSLRGAGGDGGPGIRVSAGYIEVSGVELQGGEGGYGSPSGNDGPPYVGNVDVTDPPYPVLDMEGDIHPGSSFDVTVHGLVGDSVILLLSDTPGWLDLPWRPGPPLSALPGGFFIGFHVGVIGPSGKVAVTLSMLNDPVVRGFALTSQAALLSGPGTFVLANAATRIVGE
ncbi:MAG: hypothetical protein AB1486_17940 [Planctomycetota bacterium]